MFEIFRRETDGFYSKFSPFFITPTYRLYDVFILLIVRTLAPIKLCYTSTGTKNLPLTSENLPKSESQTESIEKLASDWLVYDEVIADSNDKVFCSRDTDLYLPLYYDPDTGQ